MLLVRIGAERDQAMFLDDESPACPRGRAAGARIGLPHGAHQSPVDELPSQVKDHDEKKKVQNLFHRSLALYQFISAEIARLIVRYTTMMMAMPSIACPVWLMVVLAIETRSG